MTGRLILILSHGAKIELMIQKYHPRFKKKNTHLQLFFKVTQFQL